ncbi:MAG: hypothetical protein ACRDY7_07235 [Acidimicrobiia bacterium]
MAALMTARIRLVLLALVAVAAVSGLLAVDRVVSVDDRSAGSALSDATDASDVLAATPARSHPALAAAPGMPLVVAAAVATPTTARRGHRRLGRGLQRRLGDVGDAWRALLLGAPPALL